MEGIGLIAGRGEYPFLTLQGARKAGVGRIAVAAIQGDASEELTRQADASCWLQPGQLGELIKFFKSENISDIIMAGQITPGRLFDLKPDWKAILLLARLKKRNAETLFGAVADELAKSGINVLPATTFLEDDLAPEGWIAGPRENRSLLRDVEFGWPIAKQVASLDIGQTLVVKKGTVLAVEGFDGTDATIRRGGSLGKGDSVAIKVSKPNQDFRFDVPVIGTETLRSAAEVGIKAIVCEARKTLLLKRKELTELAQKLRITLFGRT
jgi:DUF1009 family protein